MLHPPFPCPFSIFDLKNQQKSWLLETVFCSKVWRSCWTLLETGCVFYPDLSQGIGHGFVDFHLMLSFPILHSQIDGLTWGNIGALDWFASFGHVVFCHFFSRWNYHCFALWHDTMHPPFSWVSNHDRRWRFQFSGELSPVKFDYVLDFMIPLTKLMPCFVCVWLPLCLSLLWCVQ